MKLHQLIRKARKHYNENQTEFGKRFGVTKFAVCLWESGKREAPYRVIEHILKLPIDIT